MTKRKNSGVRNLAKRQTPYLLIAPSIAVITAALLIPVAYAVYLSGTDANMLSLSSYHFVGLDNYKKFFTSPSLGKVFRSTLIYVVLGVFLTYVIGLGAALILNMKLRMKPLFRAILILPWAIPQVVLVLIWKWMLNPQYGCINYLFSSLHLIPMNFSWFSDPKFAIIAIMLVTIWKQYPLSCLILFAGMKTISGELYETASIDGASAFQRFFYITLPGLKYVNSVLVLLLTIWSFTNFVIIWLLTMGGPSDQTATLSIFTYLNAFKFSKLGYGASIGVVCLMVSLIFSFFYYRVFITDVNND